MTDTQRILQLFRDPKVDLSLDGEVWLPVKGWETLYLVSNLGRVRSISRYIEREASLENMSLSKQVYKSRVLKPRLSSGYLGVSLSNGIKCRESKLIHRLVAEAFCANPLNKKCVNHKDMNRTNNRIENLEWVTYAENEKHKRKNRPNIKYRHAEKAVNTHLLDEDVIQIRWLIKNIEGVVANDLADLYGISPQGMNGITKNRNWKSLLLA